jgi:hypothetical protein
MGSRNKNKHTNPSYMFTNVPGRNDASFRNATGRYFGSTHCLCLSKRHTVEAIKTPWPESVSELCRPSDCCLSAKLVPTFADRGCHGVSVTDPNGHILGFLYRSRYFFYQVPAQLYSRGWVDHVSDPLVLRKSGSAGNRSRNLWICSQELWPLDHTVEVIHTQIRL